MVSYFPFDFNHIRREVHPCRTAIDVRRRFCSFLRIAFRKQLDAHVFFHTLWHLLKEGSNGCVIGSAFAELHRLWCSKLFESIPRLIVGDQTLRHRVVSRFGKE